MYCKKCGTEQKEGQKFCPKCGEPFIEVNEKSHADEFKKYAQNAVDEFVMDAEQFDDLTMLCIEYRGKDNKN